MILFESIGYKLGIGCKASLNNISYYPFHAHNSDFEIVCVLDGDLFLSNSAADYTLHFGDVYFFNPKEPHKLFSDTSNIVLTIHFSKNDFSSLFEDDLIPPPYYICDSFLSSSKNTPDLRYLRFLLAKIYFEYNKQYPSELVIKKNVNELVSLLLNKFRAYYYIQKEIGKYEITRKPTKTLNEIDYIIYDIIHNQIYKKYYTHIRLNDIAKDCYMSMSVLSNHIKKSIGLTFTDLLTLARCEEAERLLADTDKTLDDIAVDVGFSNRKHLTTMFKKWYNKTPGEFRKSIKYDLNKDTQIYENPFDYKFANTILNIYLDQY